MQKPNTSVKLEPIKLKSNSITSNEKELMGSNDVDFGEFVCYETDVVSKRYIFRIFKTKVFKHFN